MNPATCLSIANCLECSAPLSPGETQGLCARCLLKMGLASQFGENSVTDAGGRKIVPPPLFPFDFGGYRMLRLLGRGGMGAVYEAEDTASGRRVALKVLGHSLDSPDTRKRFLREGRLAASINHPNSVYVYGTEEIDGTPVITMELVPGGTLHERVKAGGPLPVGEAVDVILQVVTGLEAAHTAGILHRDIKPSNCFIEPGGAVKIGDFGLSISTLSRGDSVLTMAGSVLGTPEFASPEQLRGESLDVRSDIYSVGATLYYLLTGKPPFRAENVVQLLATVLEKTAPSPRTLRSEIPEGLARIILRCLAKPTGDRFKDYDELRRALLPFCTMAPTPATLGLRFVAGFIDHMVLAMINLVLSLLFIGDFMALSDPASLRSAEWIRISVGILLFEIAYFAVPEGLRGASLGKAITGLRVGGLDRNAPGIPRATARALIYLLPAILGFIPFSDSAVSAEMNVRNIGVGIVFFLYPALLCVTARRRNGFATVTDLLTKTRVIQKSAYQAREGVAQPEDPVASTDALMQIGPYHVLSSLGAIRIGYDTKLMRRVWIREAAPDAPPVPPEVRHGARPGNLRWLQGRRGETESWDAYEAVPGTCLTALLGKRQPWKQVRHWLLDLATELDATAHDSSTPGTVSLDRVWITADGRAKLLDFPAPGAISQEGVERGAFLNQVAISALEGRVATAEEARSSAPRVPVAIRARGLLQVLRECTDFAAIAGQLKSLVQQVSHVSRLRRFGLTAGCIVPAFLCTAFSFLGMKTFETWQRQYPDVLPLRNALTKHFAMSQLKSADGERAAIEIYIAGRFGAFIRDPKAWNSHLAGSILPSMRAEAERMVAAHPNPSAEDMERARTTLGTILAAHGIESGPEGTHKGDFSPEHFIWMGFGGVFIWAAFFSIVAAILFRGGLLLRALGITAVTRYGSDASRLRMLWRACVAWSWLPLAGLIIGLLVPVAGMGGAIAAAAIFVGAVVIWSALAPERSIQDRLAGTWLVPR
jgi:eukaryotic-like serine/threonine-protein kinase